MRQEKEEDPQCAGWGFVVIKRCRGAGHEEACEVHSAFGMVTTDPEHEDFHGAEALTNDTAELAAMIKALQWVALREDRVVAAILYDSHYAAHTIQGRAHAATNIATIGIARTWLATARHRSRVRFEHVKSHVDHKFNERADQLATQAMSLFKEIYKKDIGRRQE